MFDIIDELKDKGISEENIIFISFEDLEYNLIKDFKELNTLILDKIYFFYI